MEISSLVTGTRRPNGHEFANVVVDGHGAAHLGDVHIYNSAAGESAELDIKKRHGKTFR